MMIAVIGGNDASPELLALAEEVGRELARHGCTVVCGGRHGVMEAVCRGARQEGGHTVGILPGPDTRDMNPWVEFPIITNMGYARNVIVVLSGEAVIAIDGSYGTLSEMAHALSQEIPVVGLRTWSFTNEGGLDGRVIRAKDAQDAVMKAIAAANARRQQAATPTPSADKRMD